MLSPAPAEIKENAPKQGALLHRENYFRFEISKLDCVQRPLPCNQIHKRGGRGIKSHERLAKGPKPRQNIFHKLGVLDQRSSQDDGHQDPLLAYMAIPIG